MKPEDAANLEKLWASKLTNHRKSRNDAYADLYAKNAANGLHQSGALPGKLYEIATGNLGELNVIFREITQDGWSIDSDEDWARKMLEQYRQFIRDEKTLVDKEIADFLTAKGFPEVDKVIARGQAELNLSSNIHEARYPVLVQQLISEKQRQTAERTKADSRWNNEQRIRVGSIVLLVVTASISLWTTQYTRKTYSLSEDANKRTQQLFIGEDNPQIQAFPFVIAESGKTHNSTLNFRLINYSGFDAFNVNVDVLYCVDKTRHRHWAGEWAKADKDSKQNPKQQGAATDKGYFLTPQNVGPTLKRFTEVTTDQELGFGFGSDALNLEGQVCSKDVDGLPVLVRLRWHSSKGRTYDVLQKYKLLCTKNWMGTGIPSGRSFTAIPLPGSTCE